MKSSSNIQNTIPIVERALADGDLFAALASLNASVAYRFTGVYVFEKDLVKSLLMFDRKNPDLRVGADVPWKDSYCMLVAEDGDSYTIEDSLTDPRLTDHPKRNSIQCYCAVLLEKPSGEPLGTICHFDLNHIENSTSKALKDLLAIRPLVENFLCSANRPNAAQSKAKQRRIPS